MKEKVCEHLSAIEADEEMMILYACESGSRAWGFPSTDSDYDVRIIYVHTLEWYLSIEEKRDVIERSLADQIDLSGWDLRKALKLFRKSNRHSWSGSVHRSSILSRRALPRSSANWRLRSSHLQHPHITTCTWRKGITANT